MKDLNCYHCEHQMLLPDEEPCKTCNECSNFRPEENEGIDNSDKEMDCLVCDVGEENACPDCCRDWENEEE